MSGQVPFGQETTGNQQESCSLQTHNAAVQRDIWVKFAGAALDDATDIRFCMIQPALRIVYVVLFNRVAYNTR